jgi:exodeoxyribonuclease-3
VRIISLNVNGIRSAWAKGLPRWLARQKADVVCLQEVKARELDLADKVSAPRGFEAHYHCADKRGYSGVALITRHKPDAVSCGFGSREFDCEGRLVRADYGELSVISVYQPSGSSSEERQQAKFRFMAEFYPYLKKLRDDGRRGGREFILCGDWNIAHREIDLKNWRSNRKNSGFLPEERAWLTRVFDELGWVDVFRRLDARPEQYTWWSNRGQAWAKNVGWRIDYHIATPGIAAKAIKASIYKDRRFSDHAPLTIDYDYPLADQFSGAGGDTLASTMPARMRAKPAK